MFDSLKYAKILEDSGLPREQAETHIRVLNDLLEDEMATKQDLMDVKSELKSEISNLESRMNLEFVNVRADMGRMEHRIVYKLGALMVTVTTLGIAAAQMINA